MSTNFLLFFASLLIYFSLAQDIQKENQKLANQKALIEQKILKETNIETLEVQLASLKAQDKLAQDANSALFFDKETHISFIFADLQQMVQEKANQSGITITNLSWGEASSSEETEYVHLPIALAFKGSLQQCVDFLSQLYSYDKLIYAKNFSVVQQKGSLSVGVDFYAYQNNPNYNEKNKKEKE